MECILSTTYMDTKMSAQSFYKGSSQGQCKYSISDSDLYHEKEYEA